MSSCDPETQFIGLFELTNDSPPRTNLVLHPDRQPKVLGVKKMRRVTT